MKNIFVIGLIFILSSCYEDYIKDYDYDGIYFPYQINVRSFIVGEGMKVNVGVVLGGVMSNDRDRLVNLTLDNTLITESILEQMGKGADYIKNNVSGLSELKPMPAEYYSLSAQEITIEKGQHSGAITVRPDSARFLSDQATLKAQYVLPFLITSADADSIITARKYAVIGFRYENMLFGNYYHGGKTTIKDDVSGAVLEEKVYYTTIPQPSQYVWALSTESPHSLLTNGISNGSGAFRLTLGSDGNITISAVNNQKEVLPDGQSYYNRSKLLQDRKIILSYKFSNGDGTTSYAQDTLTFRNRIRDGVNEWQDENPSHYE